MRRISEAQADPGKISTEGVRAETATASPDPYAHRRSYSDAYTSSARSPYVSNHNGGRNGVQASTPPNRVYRERRTRSWDLSADPDLLRKKRLASYKIYGIEGKLKATVKKSLHWVKGKYNKLFHGSK
ncbi:hypothetical protein KP509_01G005200 [Ceratopteris richardii]|uniref:DUF3511 domain protein n=1 Tax=Ceratopteris richardii TaxID=49495 RepID=A0A8T2VDE5_CERRI|nr:hypothetical protein KP509_01G005200 [Ceratopteris richardii]